MDLGDAALIFFIAAVPLSALIPVLLKLRKHRNFAYFRVIDGKTEKPLAGAKVYQIKVSGGQSQVVGSSVITTASSSGLRLVGTLDEKGELRRIFGHNSGALTLQEPGLISGLIGLEWVSEYLRFPEQPYVCQILNGGVTPPKKRSPMGLLPPGESFRRGKGVTNCHEKPELNEDAICWPTLEEAKANNKNGMFANYWAVEGDVLPAPTAYGGTSFNLAIDSIEKAE